MTGLDRRPEAEDRIHKRPEARCVWPLSGTECTPVLQIKLCPFKKDILGGGRYIEVLTPGSSEYDLI